MKAWRRSPGSADTLGFAAQQMHRIIRFAISVQFRVAFTTSRALGLFPDVQEHLTASFPPGYNT